MQPENNKSPKVAGDNTLPKKRTVEGGIVIEDIKQGEGQVAKPGKICQVLALNILLYFNKFI